MTSLRVLLAVLFCLALSVQAQELPCSDLSDWRAGELRVVDAPWRLDWLEPQRESQRVRLPFTWERGWPVPWGEVGFGRVELSTCLLLPLSDVPLALYFDDFKSAGRVWVDGRLALQRGTPGSAEDEVARLQSGLVELPQGASRVSLRIEMSNHFHRQGGIDTAVLLGERDALRQRADRHRALYLLTLGAALVMAVFMGLLDRSRLGILGGVPLALMLVFAGLRIASSGELFDEFLQMPALWIYRLEYLSGHLFVPAYGFLLMRLFPAETHRALVMLMLLVGLLGALLTLLFPPAFFTLLRDPLMLWLLLCQGYFFVLALRAWRAGRRGAPVIVGGMLVVVAAIANDMLLHSFSVRTINLIPLGILILLLSHGLVVGERVVTALLRSNRLRTELEQLNASLEQRVEERTLALAVARDHALHEAHQALERQLLLSHELRTPLVAMQGHLELLDEQSLPSQAVQRLATIRMAARSLTELLDGFALLSRDPNAQPPALEPFDPAGLAAGCAAIFRPQAEAKGLSLAVSCGAGVPALVDGRAPTLRQVLFNLIGNAVKFTSRGEISVEVSMETDGLCVRVGDTGPGMEPLLQQEVFHAFVRGKGETEAGMGLGLYVVARLAELMGGRLQLDSAVGSGTAISVHLPWHATAPGMAGTPETELTDLQGLRVLLVEDVEASRLVTIELLERWGCRVSAVDCGEDAVSAAAAEHFDMVLMDLRLPGIDGLQASRQIRQGPHGADLQILALTANAADIDQRQASEAGIDGLLSKPLQRESLLAAVGAGTGNPVRLQTGRTRVEQLREWLGDAQLQRLLPSVIASLREVRDGLADTGDPGRIAYLCHRLRGSALNYGLQQLAEAAGRTRDAQDAQALLVMLDGELDQLSAGLPSYGNLGIEKSNPSPS